MTSAITKKEYIESKKNPSSLDISFLLLTNKEKAITVITKKSALTANIFISVTLNGWRKETMPITKELLVALPITLPKTIVFCFFLIALRAMMISGKFVPIENTSIPKKRRGMFRELAIFIATSTAKFEA